MRVNGVVVLEPARQKPDDSLGIGQNGEAGVVALQRLHERLRDAIALRRAHGREGQAEAERGGGVSGLFCDVGAAVIREPLDRMRGPRRPEPALDARDHQVAHHLP